MQVTIRLSTDTSFSVSTENCPLSDLATLIKEQCPAGIKLPTDFKLIHNGEKLSPASKMLLDFGMGDDVIVILMSNDSVSPVLSATDKPAAPKKKKQRCSFKTCSSAPLRMVGSCSHCSGKFCAKHRLLEDHLCVGLQYCKDDAHERNAMKLQSESTIASRVWNIVPTSIPNHFSINYCSTFNSAFLFSIPSVPGTHLAVYTIRNQQMFNKYVEIYTIRIFYPNKFSKTSWYFPLVTLLALLRMVSASA